MGTAGVGQTQAIINAWIGWKSSKLSKSEKYDRIEKDLGLEHKQRPAIRRAVNQYINNMKKE